MRLYGKSWVRNSTSATVLSASTTSSTRSELKILMIWPPLIAFRRLVNALTRSVRGQRLEYSCTACLVTVAHSISSSGKYRNGCALTSTPTRSKLRTSWMYNLRRNSFQSSMRTTRVHRRYRRLPYLWSRWVYQETLSSSWKWCRLLAQKSLATNTKRWMCSMKRTSSVWKSSSKYSKRIRWVKTWLRCSAAGS